MGYLARRETSYLLALLNNGDADDPLAEEARRELAARGALPSWASAPENVRDNLDAAATQVTTDPMVRSGSRVPADAEDYRILESGGHVGVPGPRTDDGRPARMAPQFSSAKESAEYYVRPSDPATGMLLPSQADEAKLARGEVAVFTPDGSISYRPAANAPGQQDQMSPEARRRADFLVGRSADGRTDLPINANYEAQEVEGPTGPVQALVPTRESRERMAARAGRASMLRLAGAAGLPQDADLSEYTPDQLRDMAARRKGAVSADRRAAVVRRAQAAQNPLEYMGRDDVNDWQKMVMAERFLREPQKMTPLGVDAVGASNAMRMMNADALAGGMPEAVRHREQLMRNQTRQAAYDFAVEQRNAVHWDDDGPMDPALANRIRRQVAARFGAEYADVVDALPIDDGAAVPQVPRGAGQFFPGQKPPPPPANPMAAPRPFG